MAYLNNLNDMLKLNIRSEINEMDNKEEYLDEIINIMKNQAHRLELMVEKAESAEKDAKIDFEEKVAEVNLLEAKAREALIQNDEELAKEILKTKVAKEEILKEKEIIYTTRNAQTSQMKEQLITLKEKLNEAFEVKQSVSHLNYIHKNDYPLNDNTMHNYNNSSPSAIKCYKCEKSKEILDAEIERLMREIKDTHNIK